MSLTRIREGQDCTYVRFQLSTIDESSDLRQKLARHVDQKERGFDAMAPRKVLIGRRHRRDQPATPTQDAKRTLLRFAANQINDGIRVANLLLETLRAVVDDRVCAEITHNGNVPGRCGRDDS